MFLVAKKPDSALICIIIGMYEASSHQPFYDHPKVRACSAPWGTEKLWMEDNRNVVQWNPVTIATIEKQKYGHSNEVAGSTLFSDIKTIRK